MRYFTAPAVCVIVLLCGSCETVGQAARVMTHSPSSDPIDAPAGTYKLDKDHWSVTFDVDHLSYTRFVMRFDRASGDLDFTPSDPVKSKVEAVIDAASIDTKVAELDKLVKDELLDVKRYPEIRFASKQLRLTGKNSGVMEGELTIHGETRPVSLDVTFNGGARNPLVNEDTLGFTATGHFDRSTFDLTKWYPAVGNEIRVTIQAEFDKPRG